MDYSQILRRIVDRISLTDEEARDVALAIMDGVVPDVVVSALLIALRMKGESVDEIVGFVRAMREKALRIPAEHAIDIVGTGGDGVGTINVSTAAAILASMVHPVAKHGNRAVSGRSGSADVLEALGYRVEVEPSKALELLNKDSFVFLFAPIYHPAMRRVAPIRKALGVRTIFNILGPLTNPGGTRRQVIGVFSKMFAEVVAEAVSRLGYDRALVVHGEPGIDEVSPAGLTHVYEVNGSRVEYYSIAPEHLGLERVPLQRLTVSSAEESAIRILRASKGLDRDAAIFIKMNTAFALYVAGVAKDLRDGVEYADQLLPSLIDRIDQMVKANGDPERFRALLVKIS